ncbi:MAG: hypothetical protein J3K34DRAFT_445044 [Monoraphidium minutum]|nr:MAG: hypothetical protein J3K34DRAFT_445044 [Monoraphidium minutum]
MNVERSHASGAGASAGSSQWAVQRAAARAAAVRSRCAPRRARFSGGTRAAAAAAQGASGGGAPLCLKEWAVTNAALGSGEQTVLLRKGGIKELRFTPEARSFFLFPTSFHSDQQLLKPGAAARHAAAMALEPKALDVIPLGQYAEVTGAWVTSDARVLQALDPLHVWAEGFLDARLKWRQQQPLTLLELRVYAVSPPLLLPTSEELFGCFSWVGLPGVAAADIDAALARRAPAMGDAEFAERQELLRARLAGLDVQVLQL